MKKIMQILMVSLVLMGCKPSDADFDEKVNDFKSTEIGKDISQGKFIPPYNSFEPLSEFTYWCNSVLWEQQTAEENFIDAAYLKEEILAVAPKDVIGFVSLINYLVEKSGGVDAIYPYIHGDAAYLMKPSRLAAPVINKMIIEYNDSPSYKKVVALNKARPKRSASFKNANGLCFSADLLTGILGGESRSRAIIKDVSTLVRKNTLQER